MVLRALGEKRLIDAIAFNTSTAQWPDSTRQVNVAYRIDVNEYQGKQSVQLVVEHVAPTVGGFGARASCPQTASGTLIRRLVYASVQRPLPETPKILNQQLTS